jgi:hypothetical protein
MPGAELTITGYTIYLIIPTLTKEPPCGIG